MSTFPPLRRQSPAHNSASNPGRAGARSLHPIEEGRLMIVVLPPNLKALAVLTADQGHARFAATSCVRLTQEPSGLYRAEATDGYVLGIARGPSLESPDVIDP